MDKMSRLSSMVGRTVKLDRGGPESRAGQVLDLQQDYLVLLNEQEGVIYYKTDHIKSLSSDAKDYSDLTPPVEGYVIPTYIKADSFNAVLGSMKHRWVKINRGGPESVEGLLTEIYDDYILLTNNNELVSVFNFHIRSISYKAVNQSADVNKQENEQVNKLNSQEKQSQNVQAASQENTKQQKQGKEEKQEKDKEKSKEKKK
jgi:spore coat protein B